MSTHNTSNTPQALSWLLVFVCLGCCSLSGIAIVTLQNEQQRQRLARREALRLTAQHLTQQVEGQLTQGLRALMNLPQADPTEMAQTLQGKISHLTQLWYSGALAPDGQLIWPQLPWKGRDDQKLMSLASSASCNTFLTQSPSLQTGQVARLTAGLSLKQRRPSCPLWPFLRSALLLDTHERSATQRSWTFVSSRDRELWLLRGPLHLFLLRRVNQHWVGFAVSLNSERQAHWQAQEARPFKRIWLAPLLQRSQSSPRQRAISIPLTGTLKGTHLLFAPHPPPAVQTWILFVIVACGTLLSLLACGFLWLLVARMRRWEARREALFSAIGHELKTPVAAQKALLGTLLRVGLPQETRAHTEALSQETERLARLVENLVALNRTYLPPPQTQPCDITGLSHTLFERYERMIEQKELWVDFAQRQPLWVMADPAALSLALHNIIENAVKYTPEGGKIQLQIETSQQVVQWTLRNTSEPIPPSLREELFSPFVRGETRAQPGSGLGLYLARTIVRQAGGDVVFQPGPLESGGFRVTLQVSKDKGQPS